MTLVSCSRTGHSACKATSRFTRCRLGLIAFPAGVAGGGRWVVSRSRDGRRCPLAGLYDGKPNALRQLPAGAREVASFQTDVDHSSGLTWHIVLTLFVVAIPTIGNAFALLCLDWNDNWGRLEWLCERAVAGASPEGEATASFLGAYRVSAIEGAQDEFLGFIKPL